MVTGRKYVLLLLAVLAMHCSPLHKYRDSVARWEPDIQRFEQLDQQEPDPEQAIMFVGSSSIRLWNSIREDMAPYPVIQRGFGGSKLSDVAWYVRRIVYPHSFRALVFFIGNDISGAKEDKSPEEVAALFKYTLKIVRKKFPDQPVFFVAITPTNSRWKVWPQVQRANQAIKAVCAQRANVFFIDTAEPFLGADARPRSELFVQDQLHLNAVGYRLWSMLIKDSLDRHLP